MEVVFYFCTILVMLVCTAADANAPASTQRVPEGEALVEGAQDRLAISGFTY